MKAPLVERVEALAQVDAALGHARSGSGAVVVVQGPAGIGKTRLIAEIAALADGFRVLRATGGELERDIAFGVVADLLAPVTAPDELEGGPGAERALFWRVAALAEAGPVALVVDDAHWADEPSLRWLAYTARRAEGLALALIIATRPVADPTLQAIRTLPEVLRVELDPLSVDGSAELVASTVGGKVGPKVLNACHELAGGNPFLTVELAAAIAGLSDTDAVRRLSAEAPARVVETYDLRLARLGPDSRRLAGAVAVFGETSNLGDLATVAGIDGDAARIAYRALAEAAILATAATRLGFVHPIGRTAVYADLDAVERWDLHGRAAIVLAAGGAEAEVVAHHLLRAQPAGDAVSADVLFGAAARANARGAIPQTIELLERALAEPPGDSARNGVLLALAEARIIAGANEEALTALDAMTPEAALEVRMTLARGRAVAGAGAVTAGVELLDAAAGTHAGDDALRLSMEATALGMYERGYAAIAHRRAMALADLPGDTVMQRRALANACGAVAYDAELGTAERGVEIALRALSGPLPRDSAADLLTTLIAIHVLIIGEEQDAAQRAIEQHLEPLRDHSDTAHQVLGAARIMSARIFGQIDRMLAESELLWTSAVLDEADPIIARPIGLAAGCMLEAHVHRGEYDRARALLQEFDAQGLLAREDTAWVRYGAGMVRLLDASQAERAAADFLAVGSEVTLGEYEFRVRTWRPMLARALAIAGQRAEALEYIDAEVELARRWGRPGALGGALHVRATIVGPTPATLQEAVTLLEQSPLQYDYAHAVVDLGHALRVAGQRTAAKLALAQGMDAAAAIGALALVDSARDGLQILGERPRRYRISGTDALTPTERRIAERAAGGESNRQIAQALFVTLKTVESHLSNTYRKLDVSSRDQLADVLSGS